MGKISISAAKYIVHADISIEGNVERPDVIGAIFGQTEGLLGSDLELRELQKNGKIGRIEVNTSSKNRKSIGNIDIPSSLDKAETAVIGAALETIDKIGPCIAKVNVTGIEDVRISKRSFVIDRAKELLKNLTEETLPDSKELTDEVFHSVRMMGVIKYGKDKLAACPGLDDYEEIIVVEGRADVLNLLKHGIKNAIAMNGSNIPDTIIELSKTKTITAFVDGDRGGDLIIKDLIENADIDFVTKAPDGKEVEELTSKELNKALRSQISVKDLKLDQKKGRKDDQKPKLTKKSNEKKKPYRKTDRIQTKTKLNKTESKEFGDMLKTLTGTRGAYLLDEEQNILGKVPTSELTTTIKNLGTTIHSVVFDGTIDRDLVKVAEKSKIKHLIAMDTKVPSSMSRSVKISIKEDI
ncbi:DNA primase [archaeon]|mgnify:FL=1|jgi:DNA primase|nr:DNA primase [archaeon]